LVTVNTTAPAPVRVQSLSCPNCGGQVELHGFASTLTAVCGRCSSVLDTSNPVVRVLHQFRSQQKREPKVPLGSRGEFDGITYEVIGFQVRSITVDGVDYEWSEYVLFNPYRGFRYLSEYNGHWNFIWPVRRLPVERPRMGRRPSQMLDFRTYRHFQNAVAKTVFVLGEFPWRVEVGEAVEVDDYTCPPYVLSAERDGKEVNWSEGRYMEGKAVWGALKLQGAPPPAKGIYLNQPSPYPDRVRGAIRMFFLFTGLLVAILLFFALTARREAIFDESRQFVQTSADSSFVTRIFELKGRTSNVELKTWTDLNNQWAFFGYSLINAETGETWDVGREIGYYYGRDSDGDWTEGSREDVVIIPTVPSGRYFLRVEPEGDANMRVNYRIALRRDVPMFSYYMVAGLLLILPVIVLGWRTFSFEHSRWQESDYAGGSSD
jgi:hypothetical protein